jgi:hypothetical protein
MGQKTNPNIFRLSKTDNWKSKYVEKKSNEFYLYTTKDLEIRKFTSKFFKNNGLIVHNCNLSYSKNALSIYITYRQNINSVFLINDINKTQKVKLDKKNTLLKKSYKRTCNNIIKSIQNYSNFEDLNYIKNLQASKKIVAQKRKALRKGKVAVKRIKMLKYYKKYLDLKKSKTMNNLGISYFFEKFLESLSMFLNQKPNITLILKPLDTNVQKTIDQKKHALLKKKASSFKKIST